MLDVGFTMVFLVTFVPVWLANTYLMLVRPDRWVEWFLVRPCKGYGIAVSVEDQDKLRRNLRLPGWLFLVSGVVLLGFVVLMLSYSISR